MTPASQPPVSRPPAEPPAAEPPFSVTSPADILSYILHTLGFQPRESLVLLTMSGKRVGATLRVDLPTPDMDVTAYAAGLCSILRSDTAADGALMVLYTQQPWAEGEKPPHEGLVRCLDPALDAAGLRLRDGWLVTDSVWRDYFCDDPACCPWPGHPLASVRDSPLNAELVYRGSSYADSLAAAVEDRLPGPWPDAGQIQQICRRFETRYRRRWTATAQFADTLALWDRVLSVTGPAAPAAGLDRDLTAYLVASLGSRTVRDAVLVLAALGLDTAVDGARSNSLLHLDGDHAELPESCRIMLGDRAGRSAPDGARQDSPGSAAGCDFGGVLAGRYGGRLAWGRLDSAHGLFAALSAAAADEPRAALLAMLAWIEWARGRGSRAHVYLVESMKEVPGYALARLLDEVVARGGLPSWSCNKELAWRNGTPHAA